MNQGSINLAVRRYKFEYLEITDKTTTMEINKWAENINTKDVIWRLISNYGADCINEENSLFVVAIPSIETLPDKKHDLKIYSKEEFHAVYSTDISDFTPNVAEAVLESKAKMAQPAAKKNLSDLNLKTNIGPNVNIGLGVSHISGPGSLAPRTEILGDAWGVGHKGDMRIGASGSGSGLDEVSKNILKNMNKQLGRDTRY